MNKVTLFFTAVLTISTGLLASPVAVYNAFAHSDVNKTNPANGTVLTEIPENMT